MNRIASCLATSLAALGACQTPPSPLDHTPVAAVASPSGPGPRTEPTVIGGGVVPRVHTFPAGRAADVRRLFEGGAGAVSYPIEVVSSAGVQTQFVQPKALFIGTDRFVTGAPPQTHDEIDRVLASLATLPPTPSSTFEITYWIVEADVALDSQVTPDLAELAAPLTSLAGLGKRHFRTIDRLSSRLMDGSHGNLAGRNAMIDESVTADPDGLQLKLVLDLNKVLPDAKGPHLETTLQLKPDTFAVIGDAALTSATDGTANVVLYVVRAHRVD